MKASEDEYRECFYNCMGKERTRAFVETSRQKPLSKTVAKIYDVQTQKQIDIGSVEAFARADHPEGGVLVVENIDLSWIGLLGTTFQLDPSFFAEHALNPVASTPWNAVFGTWSKDWKKPREIGTGSSRDTDVGYRQRPGWHVYGALSLGKTKHISQGQYTLDDPNFFDRRLMFDDRYGWQASNCISYCLLTPSLYLFLVDAPIHQTAARGDNPAPRRNSLYVPLSLNRGGLMLPQFPDEEPFSPSECLHRFLLHPWHFHVLFALALTPSPSPPQCLTPTTLLHLLASSTWTTNLCHLKTRIHRISFDEIRRPTLRMSDALHDQRRDLLHLISQVSLAVNWIPPSVDTELQEVASVLPPGRYVGNPRQVLDDILYKDAAALEKLLMDTFNLLLSSIGIVEAEANKEQVRRQRVLTQLAFVYIPLSFVTGVFGMNVREIDGTGVSVWVCFVALAITGGCTAGVFLGYDWYRRRGRKGEVDGG